MIYLLDTDTCSLAMKRRHPELIASIKTFAPAELKVSSITIHELEFGLRRSERETRLRRVVESFLDRVEVLGFDSLAAAESGAVRAELAAAGMLIGAYDTLIAGHARAIGATVVTNDVREFTRVPQLLVENWVATDGRARRPRERP